jgi:putative heme iron utilization protein
MANLFSKVSSDLKSVEADVLKGLKSVEKVAVHIATDTTAQATVEAVSGALFGASASYVEVQAFAIVDKLADALEKNEAAFSAGLQNAGLDLATVESFKQVVANIKSVKL